MAKRPKGSSDHRQWLAETLPQHERLAAGVRSLLENMLKNKKIEHLSVTYRVKMLDDALEKIDRKKYRDPRQQLTDLSGIRVITYLEEQVGQISAVINELFEVDKANSLDRTEILGDDKVGYRSTHFVCTLGSKRSELPENEAIGRLKFEIQVRTVLQHAWAELAHDRSFKFGASLPTKIQRKLNLHSGMLEIVDRAFDEIAKEIDNYAQSINARPIEQISETDLNSISLDRYLDETSRTFSIKIRKTEIPTDVFEELANFGIKKIGDLEKITKPEYIKLIKEEGAINSLSYLRSLMMLHDIDKYFSSPFGWSAIDGNGAIALAKRYGPDKIAHALADHDISVAHNDGEEWHDKFSEIKTFLKKHLP
jgi:ppGpp synthetase/RelA/SpoT-type nucleotidyltranferase